MSEKKDNQKKNNQQINKAQTQKNQGQTASKNSLLEIDYTKYLRSLLSHWVIIVLCLIIGCAAGYAYSRFFVDKQYQADASVFVADTKSLSVGDLKVGDSLSADYIMVINSRETLKSIIDALGLDMNYHQLKRMISIKKDDDAHVITITATADDPKVAVALANTTVNVGKQRIFDVIGGSEISVMELATLDSVIEVTPSMWKYIEYGMLIGLLIPCLVLFLMVVFDRTLSNEEEITTKLKLPVLSLIPNFGDKNILIEKLSFYEREAFNTLCGNIELSGYDIKTIAFTSSMPNEGKSTISYKVAEILTEFGKQVCYLDCDMRNSCFCQNFGIDSSKMTGLSNYLSRDMDVVSILTTTNNPKLKIITPGKVPPNPAALLSSDRFKILIKQLSEKFDYVIMDTPPISAVIDGVFVAKECDGCVLVVEEGVTDSREAIKTKEALKDAKANLIGVVINKALPKVKDYGKYSAYMKSGKYDGKDAYYGYGHSPEVIDQNNQIKDE